MPTLTCQEVIEFLNAKGYHYSYSKSSHHYYKHDNGVKATVWYHGRNTNQPCSMANLNQLKDQTGFTRQDILAFHQA